MPFGLWALVCQDNMFLFSFEQIFVFDSNLQDSLACFQLFIDHNFSQLTLFSQWCVTAYVSFRTRTLV